MPDDPTIQQANNIVVLAGFNPCAGEIESQLRGETKQILWIYHYTLTLPENNILLMEVIRRSPVVVGSLSHYLHGLYIRGGAGFLSSRAAPENDG